MFQRPSPADNVTKIVLKMNIMQNTAEDESNLIRNTQFL